MTDAEKIAAGLSKEQREALLLDEPTYLEMLDLNALGLLHLDVVKGADDTLIDMTANPTPLGLAVRAILQSQEPQS